MEATASDPESSTKLTTLATQRAASSRQGMIVAVTVILVVVQAVGLLLSVPGSWRLLPFLALAATFFFLVSFAWMSLTVRGPRASRRARGYQASDLETSRRATLTPGHVVVHGKVAYAAAASSAMHVELVERGTESHTKNGWSHAWTEQSRRLTVRPFYLVRDDGQRIRVEPEAQTAQLFDELDAAMLPTVARDLQTEPGPLRTRVARLDAGETAWVVGELAQGEDPEDTAARDGGDVGYRQNARPLGWVLRGAPKLLVSSVSLVDHFTERARLHRRQGLVALLLLALPLLVASRYVDRLQGHAVVGTVTSTITLRNKHGHVTGYRAVVRAEGNEWQSEQLDSKPTVASPYPLWVGRSSSNDGTEVHWTSGECVSSLVIFVLIGILVLALRGSAIGKLPWYRSRGRFVESGKGRLEVP